MKVVNLAVKAFVKAPVSVSPSFVNLFGKAGLSITKVVEIRAGLEKPLTLTPENFNLDGKVTYSIEEIEKERRFRIYFKSIPGPSKRFYGFLNLKTNYPERPSINIRIRGRFVGEEEN